MIKFKIITTYAGHTKLAAVLTFSYWDYPHIRGTNDRKKRSL